MLRWVVVLLCGCGRIAFDPVERISDAATDGVSDGDSTDAPPANFAFVQGASQIGNNVMQIDVVIAQPFTVGNVVVVTVGTTGNPSITSVTDDIATVYTRAVGPTVSLALQQSMYVGLVTATAANNTVHVVFDVADSLPGALVAEYSGVSTTTTVLTTSGNTNQSTNSSSGSVNVVSTPVLLVGANANALSGTLGPGPGFTERVRNAYEDIIEDRVITTPGTYVADAPLTTDHVWVMQAIVLAPR